MRVLQGRRRQGEVALAVAALVALGARGAAEPAAPVWLAALAPASDARRAIAIGPAGQVYEPDGRGEWTRRRAGGVATAIASASRDGDAVIAGGAGGPPYRFANGTWSSLYLGQRAKPVVGRGPRATAAVGRTVFTLDHGAAKKLADAPDRVTALAASADGVVVETARGVYRRDGSAWKLLVVPRARTLASERWMVIERGCYDLRDGKRYELDFEVDAATATDAALVVVGRRGGAVEVATVRAGKLERAAVPIDPIGAPVAVVTDRDGRIVVAFADGRLAVRGERGWTTAVVRDELPAARVGPPPAPSR